MEEDAVMASTFIRGLNLLEVLDHHGPLTITELAARTGMDKGTVSRTVSACVTDGWLARAERGVVLGPRCALLGRRALGSDVISRAEPLVHAVAGATGLMTQAFGLVGPTAVLFASAGGRGGDARFSGMEAPSPLHIIAAGRAIAAQLTSAELDAHLPPEPFPDGAGFMKSMGESSAAPLFTQFLAEGDSPVPKNVPTTRDELDRQLDLIRQLGAAFDRGELHPALACIAVPWPHLSIPAALACLGTPAQIAANEPLALRCLTTAIGPVATPQDVIAAAAQTELASKTSLRSVGDG
jgi:DNA-binding IclR family transcriptional regulator